MIRSHRRPTSRAARWAAAAALGVVAALAGGAVAIASIDSNSAPIVCPAGVPIVLEPADSGDHGTWACTPIPTVTVPTTVTETTTTTVTQPPETVTETVTVTATTTPTATASPSPSTTAPPTPPPGVVHGRDITAANTGVQPGACATVQVFSSRVRASVLGSRSCVDLRGGLDVDAAITLEQSRVRGPVGGDGPRLTLRWVTVDGAGSGEYGVYHRVDCYRCNITGASDGVRFSGTNLVESYVRVRQTSSADHNDGVQAYLGSEGGSILRSNIDTRPVNASNCGNAAIFIADRSRGEIVIRDNWLGGGGYTLRLHESATYRVTGNILSGWCFGPVSTTNAIPGAFVEWSNNRTDAGAVVNP